MRETGATRDAPRVIHEVRQFLSAALGDQPTAVVVAVSGGPDSVCLAHAVATIGPSLGLRPTLAHLNHQLRGADSDADEAHAQALADRLGFAWVGGHADVRAKAAADRTSLELAARSARLAFLAQAARSADARFVLTGHHADDQAETVLLRLIRGSGIRGLRGMLAVSPLPGAADLRIARPLLRVTRAEILEYCAAHGLAWRDDASNMDPAHLRNRIRNELLPLLEQYNPGIRRVLVHTADAAALDSDILEAATHEAWLRSSVSDGISRHAWRALSAGLQRAVLREAVRRAAGDLLGVRFAGIEEARAVLLSPADTAEVSLRADIVIRVARDRFHVVAHSL